jgi:LysR family transcriptional regulator, transcriptional activator for dmlA
MLVSPGAQPSELGFFSTLSAAGSLSAAAREMGLTTAAISKRLTHMEARLGVALVVRTTRRMNLTPEGELYLMHARRILSEIDEMEQLLGNARGQPTGLLRVNATLGFGRGYVAPVVSRFARANPQVEVQLQLSVNPPPLSEDAYDVCIRFGEPPDARVIARRLAGNRRLLCASPAYLQQHGTPRSPSDLTRHQCIGIRQGDEGFGVWKLTSRRGAQQRTESIKTRGHLSTNDGEIAVKWALEGHGVLMRAEWDVRRYLRSGRLVEVLPEYRTPDADIYAIHAQRHQLSPRVRAFVRFVEEAFAKVSADHEP